MLEEYDTLVPRTQVTHYWIYDVLHLSDDAVVYRAEDMRINRDILLKEYFPRSIARRHWKKEGGYTVYTHPTESSRFQELKAEQSEIAHTLRWTDHPSISPVSDVFEANGTVYTVFKPYKAIPLHRRFEGGRGYAEREVVHFARSLTAALTLLRERGIAVGDLHAANMEIGGDEKAVVGSRADLLPAAQRSEQEVIRDLGLLLLEMMRGQVIGAGEEHDAMLPGSGYSPAICGLVGRMMSTNPLERPKSLGELQALLEGSHSADHVLELMRHGSGGRPLSAVARMSTLVLIALLGGYLLFSHPKPLDLAAASWFDGARLHLAAYLGIADAQRALGEMYEKGTGVKRDAAAALEWYYKAANQGNLYAQLSLGHFYEAGIGVPKEATKAAYWFQQAAKQGDTVAQYNMGLLCSEGRGVAQNPGEARKWFEQAAAQEIARSAKLPTDAGGEGSIPYELALMYYNGRTLPKDYGKAFLLARAAAARQHVAAYYLMGQLYQNGYGVDRDYSEALKWYEQGARRHDERNAQAALGYLYAMGLGIPADHATAVHWYRKAAEQGDADGQYALAHAYECGEGIDADPEKALYWYNRASEGSGGAIKRALLPLQNNCGG